MKYLLPLTLLIMGCTSQQKKEVKPELVAITSVHSENKQIHGDIKIEELKDEIKVTTDIKGLKPDSKLGFHIHEKGVCDGPGYKTAGDHLNPGKHEHGRPESSERHLGDMGNLVTNAQGISRQVILLPKSEANDVKMIIGKAILIHEKEDDLKSSPSGNSGERIACGIIKAI